MSIVTRFAESANEIKFTGRRQVHRVQLDIEGRRLNARVRSELAAIGEEVVARIEAGTLELDSPIVTARIEAIARLRGDFAQKQAAADESAHKDGRPKRLRTSIANVDHNATPAAAVEQSAQDEAADEAGIPAEKGGEG